MIEVIKRNEVPIAEATCTNCGSILKYGNADLHEYYLQGTACVQYLKQVKHYALRCPVCGISFDTPWVIRKEETK